MATLLPPTSDELLTTTRSVRKRLDLPLEPPCFSSSRRDARSGSPHLKVSNSPHVLAPSQSQLRKDTTEESENAGLPWRRFLQPVAFVPRWVDLKKAWKSPDAVFVVACHSPTPIQFRVWLRCLSIGRLFDCLGGSGISCQILSIDRASPRQGDRTKLSHGLIRTLRGS
jgi:hypothetical protein